MEHRVGAALLNCGYHADFPFQVSASSLIFEGAGNLISAGQRRKQGRRFQTMRAYSLIAMLSVTAGCSGAGDWQSGVPTAPDTTQVGQTKQAAQFADATVMNLVDPGSARLTVTADGDAVTVQI